MIRALRLGARPWAECGGACDLVAISVRGDGQDRSAPTASRRRIARQRSEQAYPWLVLGDCAIGACCRSRTYEGRTVVESSPVLGRHCSHGRRDQASYELLLMDQTDVPETRCTADSEVEYVGGVARPIADVPPTFAGACA